MIAIHTVLFDLGNVLAHIDFDAFWRSLGLHGNDSRPYADGYAAWTKRYETGLIPTREYLDGLHSVFSGRYTHGRLEEAFTAILLDPVDGMADLVRTVTQSRRTALVSNTNEIHYRISTERYDAMQYLADHYLSYVLHAMKPAKEFYNGILRAGDKDPGGFLFIDDIPNNVEAAQRAGMQGVVFRSVRELERTLVSTGVLADSNSPGQPGPH